MHIDASSYGIRNFPFQYGAGAARRYGIAIAMRCTRHAALTRNMTIRFSSRMTRDIDRQPE